MFLKAILLFTFFNKNDANAYDGEDDTDGLDDKTHRDWLSKIRHLLPLHNAHISILHLLLGISNILDILLVLLLGQQTRLHQH